MFSLQVSVLLMTKQTKNLLNWPLKGRLFPPPHPSSQDGVVCVKRSIWFPEPLGSLWLRWDVLRSAVCWDTSASEMDFSSWCLAGTHCWWPRTSPLWLAVRSSIPHPPLVHWSSQNRGSREGIGRKKPSVAFSAGHFAMMKAGSATFPCFSPVKGSTDFQCSRIQTDLLIFNSLLPVSRSLLKVAGCGSKGILSPFLTYFPFRDSLQHWDICSFSCRGNFPWMLICALLCSSSPPPSSDL